MGASMTTLITISLTLFLVVKIAMRLQLILCMNLPQIRSPVQHIPKKECLTTSIRLITRPWKL